MRKIINMRGVDEKTMLLLSKIRAATGIVSGRLIDEAVKLLAEKYKIKGE